MKAKITVYNANNSNYKGEKSLEILKEAIGHIGTAMDIIAKPPESAKGKEKGASTGEKNKYGFLVYNASICFYRISRYLLRENWQKNFTEIWERIYKLFEELDEPDHNWRCRCMLIYFQCLYDSDKKQEAFKVLDLLWEKNKKKPCDFQDSLFRLRVDLSKENSSLVAALKKDVEGSDPKNGWKVLEALQRIRSGTIPEAQVEKELMGVVNQISMGVLNNS